MPLSELIRYFNAADSAGQSTLYPEGKRVAAWHNGLHLASRFQPIVDLAQERIVGHQATLAVRSADGTPLSPEAAYAHCSSPESIVHFDRLCRTLHALNFLAQQRYAGGYLQVAIHPRHLLAVQNQHGLVYEAILKRCGLAPEDIVLDIDANGISDDQRLDTALANYRRRGYRLALHQTTALNEDLLQRLQPAIVRLSEIGLSDTVDRLEPLYFELSGIDNADDLAAARTFGIQLGLGRLFGEPAADCRPTHNERRVAYNSPTPTGVTP